MPEKSVFAVLSAIDITGHTKKKGNITYLPWSSAWAFVKDRYPGATYDVVKTPEGCIYHTDGKTCWVETEVTIEGETQRETLAVMDHKNASIPADTVTSVAFERSIKRCLTKNLALFGLGLSLWNGEELSDNAKAAKKQKEAEDAKAAEEEAKAKAALDAANQKITDLCVAQKEKGVDSDAMWAVVCKYTGGKKNPKAIKSIEDSDACYKEIEAMK